MSYQAQTPHQIRVSIESEDGKWIAQAVRVCDSEEYQDEIRAAAEQLVGHLVRGGLRLA